MTFTAKTPVLLTGVAGFIGYHVTQGLLKQGIPVVGVDNMTPYYNIALKHARLSNLTTHSGFHFNEIDISDRKAINKLFFTLRPAQVLHFAAQAGVRYSLEAPFTYIDSNLVGTGNILEGCHKVGTTHLLFASSSSVYGCNVKVPFAESDPVDHPVSLYAATKRANELMVHTYSHLYGLPATGLRFFTVYGPWGRPDMAYFKFAEAIRTGALIKLFNYGNMQRDFTYIDDVVESILRLLPQPPTSADCNAPDRSTAPFRIYNIGNSTPVTLQNFVTTLERHLGRSANIELAPIEPGDMQITYADVGKLAAAVGFAPRTSLDEGLKRFVDWFDSWHAQPKS